MLPMAYFVRYRKPLPRWDASVIYGNDGLALVPDDQRLATIKRTALYKCAKMPSYGFQIDLARVVDSETLQEPFRCGQCAHSGSTSLVSFSRSSKSSNTPSMSFSLSPSPFRAAIIIRFERS